MSHALTPVFQLPHDAVAARMTLSQGLPRAGTIFPAVRVPQHDGPETPLEMLNRPEPFFPFRPSDEGNILLVAKSQLIALDVDHDPISDPDRLSAARELRLELVLSNGTTIAGSARVELPSPQARTLDYLNAGGVPFFALSNHGSTHYVNRAHVLFARPQD